MLGKNKVLIIFGTRPEAIKMAPVIHTLKNNKMFDVKVCVTGQHREMLDQVLTLFEVIPDYDLNIMKLQQSLTSITSDILTGLEPIFSNFVPDLILVHGDTSTSFVASLAAFYHKTSIGHVEAGLRTNNLYSPWPEEGNRKLTAVLTNLHLAPTNSSRLNLLKEGVNENNIIVTGNTVIDALLYVKNKINNNELLNNQLSSQFDFLPSDKKIILVTAHRRENHGKGFEVICKSLQEIALKYKNDVHIVYPVHLSPNVQVPVRQYLSDISNISLIEPLEYLDFVYLMEQSYLILTDSGGVQEEAPSLGKPILLLRDTTERPEAVEAGTVKMVGSDSIEVIVQEIEQLLNNKDAYREMSQANNPYGDGKASKYIEDAIENFFKAAK